jgi:CheY-like chemotaxis protein
MSAHPKKVLFLDDQVDFLEMIRSVMGRLAGTNWQIHIARNAGEALHLIQDRQIDLVVVDMHMPVIDGKQFLALLNRRHPNILKAVLTSDMSEVNRAECLSRGANVFLEKPVDANGWQGIYKTLNELTTYQPEPEEGFRGVLQRVGLQDVLQMECLSRNSSILEIATREARGKIYIEDGQVTHAEAGQRAGTDAFDYIMSLSGGEFQLKPFSRPAQRTIDQPWEFLVMEAARKRDESALGAPPEQPVVVPQNPITNLAAPAIATPARAPEIPRPRVPTPPSLPTQPTTPTRTPQPPPTFPVQATPTFTPQAAPHIPGYASRTAFLPKVAALGAPDVGKPEIAEFLIFSSQGDLLYDWQCQHVAQRVNFLEFISQKARQIGQGLPLGQFEGFQIYGSKSRVLTQFENDHAIFVRTNMNGAAPTNSQ